MASFSLSLEARRDIRSIFTYTADTWSITQAEKYAEGMIAVIRRLAEKPEKGKIFSDERPDYLSARYEQHQIFFRRTLDGIFIVRVLHQRMDFLRHL